MNLRGIAQAHSAPRPWGECLLQHSMSTANAWYCLLHMKVVSFTAFTNSTSSVSSLSVQSWLQAFPSDSLRRLSSKSQAFWWHGTAATRTPENWSQIRPADEDLRSEARRPNKSWNVQQSVLLHVITGPKVMLSAICSSRFSKQFQL